MVICSSCPINNVNGLRFIGRPVGRPIGGESLGFFGNIGRAFKSTFDKPATEQEKQFLRPTFQAQKFLTDNLIKPLAPPLGVIGDKQRQFLENKYLGQGRPMKRRL